MTIDELERLKREIAEDVQAIEKASDGDIVPVHHSNALELSERFKNEKMTLDELAKPGTALEKSRDLGMSQMRTAHQKMRWRRPIGRWNWRRLLFKLLRLMD